MYIYYTTDNHAKRLVEKIIVLLKIEICFKYLIVVRVVCMTNVLL